MIPIKLSQSVNQKSDEHDEDCTRELNAALIERRADPEIACALNTQGDPACALDAQSRHVNATSAKSAMWASLDMAVAPSGLA